MSKRRTKYRFVEDAIESALKENSKRLSLAGWMSWPLQEIPKKIFELAHLEELDLSFNAIRQVSERIRELPNLKKLDLRFNPLKKIPDIPGLHLDWNSYQRCRGTLSSRLLKNDLECGGKRSATPLWI